MKHFKKYALTKSAGLFFFGMPLFFILVIAGCKKDKTDFEYDNRQITDARKNSSVRIINLAGYNQAQVNGDTLTNYILRVTNDPLAGYYPATRYFPDGGRLSSTWNIPQELLKDGKARLKVENLSLTAIKDPLEIDLQEDGQQPFDYYLLPTANAARVTGQPSYVKVPRSVAAPSNPSHFKVRILNLCATVPPDQAMENLTGPMSLAWADGTLVDSKTNNIQPGQYSEYIELPYFTGQLKVLNANSIQLPGVASDLVLNPSTSTIEGLSLTYVPLKTYVPGGVYTIVIAARNYVIPYRSGNPGETVNGYQNGLSVMNDVAEPVNLTYGRMQAVNALPGTSGMQVRVNGKPLGTAIDFTNHTDYDAFVTGDYTVEAINGAGNVMASLSLKLDGNANFTLWVHADAGGKTTISAVANNLSGTFAREASDDATYARFKDVFPVGIRFLNLCPDLPYLTMTTDNAQSFSSLYGFSTSAVNNLRPGVIPIESPYISAAINANPYQLMAFRSSPTVIPGTWASDISVLTGQDLIARRELYTRGSLPNQEPGFYTVALVGSTNPAAPAAQKAKLIVVKHSK